ncbi:rhamnogalacturonan-hydrolase [Rickenella mellea]|uniref:Rhamnogalacturonan-hydrolase n=1 Tax=Rickenella mellea TaxID=50990 RepID=A0A4Y7QDE3_9AGAM|nr:rhamnogalacturonan-hydrolase [Rickenella mellea]
MLVTKIATALFLGCSLTIAQLIGPVGPTTSPSAKRAHICNVLKYGGKIDSLDIGPAIGSAFANCVLKTPGSTLYVPPGNYDMVTWQTLTGGTTWAFQMDGFITRTGNSTGHMIIIQNSADFEIYSSTSAGGFQGHGYLIRDNGPRFLRVVSSTNWSVHDLIFVDSPEFHIVVDQGSNGELYNLAIRGADMGGSDGIDISGSNHWVHDVEVTNRDECVTVKSPANHFLIEQIWCNQSGGSAIGSLSRNAAVQNIVYRNIYTNGGNQMMMIKSNGGSGFVRNVLFQNFLGRGTKYCLNVDQYWSGQTAGTGAGVSLMNITFENWDGANVYGLLTNATVQRSPIQFLCASGAPCTGINLDNVNLWCETGTATNVCENAFGDGSCLQSGDVLPYSPVTMTISQPPAFTTPPSLPGDLDSGFPLTAAIPVPTIPSTFFPGLPQISPLARLQ